MAEPDLSEHYRQQQNRQARRSGTHAQTDHASFVAVAVAARRPADSAQPSSDALRNQLRHLMAKLRRGFRLVALTMLAAFFAASFSGCRSLSRSCPKAQSIAAREQGQLGLQFLQRGKLEEAEARFAHAIEDCPEDVRLRHDLAVVHREQGRMAEAINVMKEAVGPSGSEPTWLAELALMQLAQGNLVDAWTSADRAIERQPSLALAWKVRGDVFSKSGRHQDALRDYHRALSEGEDSPDLLMQVADTYRALGRPRRALSTLQRIADGFGPEQHPRKLPFAQGLAYQALSRHDEALQQFMVARQVEGDQPFLLTQMAISQWHVGDPHGAQETLVLASQSDPQNPQIIGLLAELQKVENADQRVATAQHVEFVQ